MKCSSCDGTEHLRPYSPWHSIPICIPCFMVWYDGGINSTDPKAVGKESLRLKANKEWPWRDEDLQWLASRGK